MLRLNPGFAVVQGLTEELIIMRAFINQQEKQISDYIENIDQYVETAEVGKWYPISDEEAEIVVEDINHIEGISEDDYDFKAIFTEDMPSYQRQAMLVALWGRLECKLDDVVKYLANLENKKRKRKPQGTSDFLHLIHEMNRFGVNIKSDSSCKLSINILDNEVREIRNTWVHNGGVPSKKKITKFIDSNPNLSIVYKKINVSNKYIISALDEMVIIANKVSTEINAKPFS